MYIRADMERIRGDFVLVLPEPHEHRRMNVMPAIKRFDHIGITVADLDAVTAFFVGLGLEVDGRMFVDMPLVSP